MHIPGRPSIWLIPALPLGSPPAIGALTPGAAGSLAAGAAIAAMLAGAFLLSCATLPGVLAAPAEHAGRFNFCLVRPRAGRAVRLGWLLDPLSGVHAA